MICVGQYRAAIGRWHIFCCYRPKKIKRKYNCKLGQTMLHFGKKLRPSLLLMILSLALLLLRAGDIEKNPGPPGLSICHINARSLCPTNRLKRIDEIHSVLALDGGYDLICVSETWLNNTVENEAIQIPGFQIFRNDRNGGIGGGVAIYAKDTIPVRRRMDLEGDELEMITLEVTFQKKRFIIACCYRAPGANARQAQDFIDQLQGVVNDVIEDKPESLFILGDMNDRCISWEDDHRDSELGTKLLALVNQNNLFQIIEEPTHVTPNNASLLNIIITDSPG